MSGEPAKQGDASGSGQPDRRRVRKKRSSGQNYMMLSRERVTWGDLFKKDRPFLVVLSLVVGLGVLGLILLPPVWRVSPRGFTPVIRVNGMDLFRLRLAARAATAAEARGDGAAARESWRQAVAANGADLESKRRFLAQCVLRGYPEPLADLQRFELLQSTLLLQLGSTNIADLELTAAVAHVAEQEERALANLQQIPSGQLTLAGQVTWASAAFELGRLDEFARWLGTHPWLATNSIVRLQLAAVQAGGVGAGAAEGLRQLESVRDDPQLGVVANRLHLRVAVQRRDEPGFRQAYTSLQNRGAIRSRDQILEWQLLSLLGRPAEAEAKARLFNQPAGSADEGLAVVQALDRLGLPSKAIEYGRRTLLQWSYDPRLWQLVGRLLVRAGNPENLLAFVGELNQAELEGELLTGFSNYCLGVAEQQLGHRQRAVTAFSTAADLGPVRDPLVNLESAEMMRDLGHPGPADRIREAVAFLHGATPGFWNQVQAYALEYKSEGLMLESSVRAYRLNSSDSSARHNYAGALLLNRTNAAEALSLTSALLAESPGDFPRVVNHGQALALNRQYAEAERLFAGVAKQQVDPAQANEYFLTRGEVLIELDRRREASLLLSQVDEARLFPSQVRKLRLLRERGLGQ